MTLPNRLNQLESGHHLRKHQQKPINMNRKENNKQNGTMDISKVDNIELARENTSSE